MQIGAVTTYGAGPIIVAIWAMVSPKRLAWLKAGLLLQTAVILCLGVALTGTNLVDSIGLNNSVKRLRAWPETAKIIESHAREGRFDIIATDNRLVFYDLNHYGTGETPLQMWGLNANPKHHADLTRALTEGQEKVLLVSQYENFETYFREDFRVLTQLDPVIIPLGPGKSRHLFLYEASGYKRTTRNDRR